MATLIKPGEEAVLWMEMPMHYPNSSMTQRNSPKRPSVDGGASFSVTLAETIK